MQSRRYEHFGINQQSLMWESLEEADMVFRRNERVRKARVRRDDQILKNIKRPFLEVYPKSTEWNCVLSFRELLNVLCRLKWSGNDSRQYTLWPINLSRDSKTLTQSPLRKDLRTGRRLC